MLRAIKTPNVETTLEDDRRDQAGLGLTEETDSITETKETVTQPVRERRNRTAKAIAEAIIMPNSRSVRSTRRQSTAPKTTSRGKPRGKSRGRTIARGASRGSAIGRKTKKSRSEEMGNRNENPAYKIAESIATDWIDLHSNLCTESPHENLETQEYSRKLENINLESDQEKIDSLSKTFEKQISSPNGTHRVRPTKIQTNPTAIARENNDTEGRMKDTSFNDDWLNTHFNLFPETPTEDLKSELGNCLEEKEVRKPELVEMEVNDNPESETQEAFPTNQMQNHIISKVVLTGMKSVSKPRRRAPTQLNKPKKKVKENDHSASEITIEFAGSWLEEGSTSQTVKPKKKRGHEPKSKPQTPLGLNVSEPVKVNENPGAEIKDLLLSTRIQVNPITTQEVRPKVKRKKEAASESPIKRIKSEPTETTNLVTDDESAGSKTPSELVSAIMKPKMKRKSIPRRRLPKKIETEGEATNYPKVDSAPETLETKDVRKKSLIVKPKRNSLAKSTEALDIQRCKEYHLLKHHILRCPITNENKDLLLAFEHQPHLVLWNIFHSDQLSNKQKLLLAAAKKSRSQKNQTERASNVKTADTSQSQKKNTTVNIRQSNKKTRTQVNKAQKKMYSEKANKLLGHIESVRCPDTIGTSATETGVSSVLETDSSSILQKCSTREGTQASNFGRNEESTKQEDGSIVMLTMPMLELGNSLDLSIHVASEPITETAEFLKPSDSSVTEFCHGKKKPSSQDGTKVHASGFGCSTFHVTNLSNSFVEIIDDNMDDLTQTENIAKLSEELCGYPTLQENELREESVTFHKFPQPNDEVDATTSSAAKYLKGQDSTKTEQLQATYKFPIKVSLPISYYADKLLTTRAQKWDTVVEQKKLSVEKTQKGESNDTPDHQSSVSCSIYEVDLSPDTANVRLPEVQRRSATIQSANRKNLPTIIGNELLPKGTVELSFISCRSTGNTNNRNEGKEEIRELTIHNQSTFTSIVNLPQSDSNVIVIGDNIHQFENLDQDPPSCNHLTQEHGPSNVKSPTSTDKSSEVRELNFDPMKLWKICPELESYYGEDDVVNNNNDKLTDFDPVIADKVNGNDVREDLINADSDMEIESNNINANIFENSSEGVVAAKADPYETRAESPACVASHCTSTSSSKTSLVANLTTTNLRNFTIMLSRREKGGVNWSIEQCRHYILHGNDSGKCGEKDASDAGTEIGCKATSTNKSEKELSLTGSKKLKRKWIKEGRGSAPEETKTKRVKLNRRTWSSDHRQDSENVSIFSVQSSICGSVTSENAGVSNTAKHTEFGKKSSRTETQEVQKETGDAGHKVVPEELEETLLICQRKRNDDNANLSSTISDNANVDLANETPNCAFENDSLLGKLILLQGRLRTSQSSQDVQINHDCNKSVDSNGDSMSTSSSSNSSGSSSTSQSSRSSTTSHKSSTNSEKLNEKETVKDDTKPNGEESKTNQEDEEVDDDILSLGGNSLYTMYNDQATDLSELMKISPMYQTPTESFPEKFQDMADVSAYFDKNVQECNEAYESCVPEDKDVYDTSIVGHGAIRNQGPAFLGAGQEAGTSGTAVQGLNLGLNSNLNRRLGPLRSFPANTFTSYGKEMFRGRCFKMLKQGRCTMNRCNYSHQLSMNLQTLGTQDVQRINEVIGCAILYRFNYFVNITYRDIIGPADYLSMVKLFHKLVEADLMTEQLVRCTVSSLTAKGISLRDFMIDAASMINDKNQTLDIENLLIIVGNAIEPGTYWDTFRDLLITMNPSNTTTEIVLKECIYQHKGKSHIKDVYLNYMLRLPVQQLLALDFKLREEFEKLLKKHKLIYNSESLDHLPSHRNSDYTPAATVSIRTNHTEVSSLPTILSPDDAYRSPYNNSVPVFPGYKQVSQMPGTQALTKNIEIGSEGAENNHNFFDRRRDSPTPASSMVRDISSPELNIRTLESSAANSLCHTWKLDPIDNLPPPCSVWRRIHLAFHGSMSYFTEALKTQDYTYVMKILNEYSDAERTLFTSSCYQMLRKSVMTSAHHVKNLIHLSVRMGLNKFPNQTFFNLGMYLMIELCNSNAWVLAYGLFKSLQNSGLMEKVAAFALISAEVCLANRRPMKAFNILKQNNMLCQSRSKWRVAISKQNDEHNRVLVMNLLLDVLCEEYPDHAYHVFTQLLREQTCNYRPIDLTACVDKLVVCILNGKSEELITDIGKLIIEHNFMLDNSVFQSLVVSVFEHDVLLSKRLYCYGTWLGVYSIIQVTPPLHILIKTDYKRAEMYLVIADFIDKLSQDVGPAVDRLGPNHFTIYLVFELVPFKKKLADNSNEIYNNDELKASKQLMKTVLKEDFNPPLKTIIAERETSMKLQSRSVVHFLKSMNP